MAAFQRGRKAYYQRKRQKQRKSRKIQSRRRKLYSRRKQRTRTRSVMRLARNRYQRRRLPITRYFDRQTRNNVLSSPKAKYTMSACKRKALNRKPLRVSRPSKKKDTARGRSRILQARMKKRMSKKLSRRARKFAEKKGKRMGRYSDNEIFYRLANTSMQKPAADDRQSKKHSVRFTTPGNSKPKESETQEDLPAENQQNQQAGPLKKRGRHSATPVCKSY